MGNDNDKLLLLLLLGLGFYIFKEEDQTETNTNSADCESYQNRDCKSYLNTNNNPALRNNNPGNIVRTSSLWKNEIPYNCSKSTKFKQFPCWNDGVRAMIVLLKGSRYLGGGQKSVREIIKIWAPQPENTAEQQNNYINFVANKMSISPDKKLLPSKYNLESLVVYMSWFEQGSKIVSHDDFENAWKIL